MVVEIPKVGTILFTRLTANELSLLLLLLSATTGLAVPLLLLINFIVKLFGIDKGITTGIEKSNSPPTEIAVGDKTVVSNVELA